METKECNEEEQCVQSAVKPTAIASCFLLACSLVGGFFVATISS